MPKNLETTLAAFERERLTLLAELRALDPSMLEAKVRPEKWSILEIVEHLVLAEREVFAIGEDPAELFHLPRTLVHRFRYLAVLGVLKFGIPVAAPSPGMLPRGGRSLDELGQDWSAVPRWLRRCAEHWGEGLRGASIFEHPIAGPLTMSQALRVGAAHLDGHLRQIRAIEEKWAEERDEKRRT